MIRINLMGGLGNQMFQYAYARALSEKFHDEKIEINPYFSKYCNLFTSKTFKATKNALFHLCLNKNVRESQKVAGMFHGLINCIDYTLNDSSLSKKLTSQQKFESRSRKGIYQMYAFTYYRCSSKSRKNKYVTGYFQNEKYFRGIRDILLEEFKVKTTATAPNQLKIKELQSCNSVCVHIRRGDYTLPKYSIFNVCGEKYYQRGMDYIEQYVDNPVFYIFSNTGSEIQWIKENYHFKQKVQYVDLNNPDYEDLRLMYNCKHFIISNSSFSWWGSYLAQDEGKIVIAPAVWQKETLKGEKIDIYRSDMIKIDVD